MIRFLERQGFEVVRIRGSHRVLRRGSSSTSVPVHGHQSLKIGTLRKTLRDVELSPGDFLERWNT